MKSWKRCRASSIHCQPSVLRSLRVGAAWKIMTRRTCPSLSKSRSWPGLTTISKIWSKNLSRDRRRQSSESRRKQKAGWPGAAPSIGSCPLTRSLSIMSQVLRPTWRSRWRKDSRTVFHSLVMSWSCKLKRRNISQTGKPLSLTSTQPSLQEMKRKNLTESSPSFKEIHWSRNLERTITLTSCAELKPAKWPTTHTNLTRKYFINRLTK